MKYRNTLITALLATLANSHSAQARPIVLELYTSQGCSSCPPADAILQELSKDPNILALSFHVHYWDYLGWRDPFSSEQNTKRQYQYANSLHQRSVFTPQLVVDGAFSAVGSNSNDVSEAIRNAQKNIPSIPITLSVDNDKKTLKVHVDSSANSPPAAVFAARYRKADSTQVEAGENSGRTLNHVNSVIEYTRLGSLENQARDYHIPLPTTGGEGIAIIVQGDGQGRILGAQSYLN